MIILILKKLIIDKQYLFILIISVFCFSLNCDKSSEVRVIYPEFNYNREIYVSRDYIFENEGLNQPKLIRNNPVTNENVVIDAGNDCIYIFTQEGKFVRKIGRPGQGPGDLLGAEYLAIDMEGDIYVYERKNQRISIFSKEGKYLNSFRIQVMREDPSFFVNNRREILAHIPGREYYITIFSREGDIIKEIGEIHKYNKSPLFDRIYNKVYPFEDEKGNYVIFFNFIPLVKVFDSSGKLILEKSLENELGVKVEYPYPEKLEIPTYKLFFHEILYRNNNYYISLYNLTELENSLEKMYLYKFDHNFNLEKKIYLPLPDKYNFRATIYMTFLKFEVQSDPEIIFLPFIQNSEILKFSMFK